MTDVTEHVEQDEAPELTPEEQAAMEAADLLRNKCLDLLEKPGSFQDVVKAMVTARQLYVVAYRELGELVEDLPEDERLPQMEETFASIAINFAGQPFDENELFANFERSINDWLKGVVDKHNREDAAAAKKDRDEAEERRRARPVPIGFAVEGNAPLGDQDATVERSPAVVLVGQDDPLRYLFNHSLQAALLPAEGRHPYHVIRLTKDLETQTPDDNQARLVTVRTKDWEGCGADNEGFGRLFGQLLASGQIQGPPDLVLVEDLTLCLKKHQRNVSPKELVANVAKVQKRLSKFCQDTGCLLLAGFPYPSDPGLPDLGDNCWDRLKTHTTLRLVTCQPSKKEDGQLVVAVGNNNTVSRVPADVLSRHGKESQLVLPN